MFYVTKKYDHTLGWSCSFRQWKAKSHCSKIHGYPFAVELVFKADKLNDCNWVIDFGGLKPIKKLLEDWFDHKTMVARDDPHIEWYREGQRLGTMDLVEVQATGCESVAHAVFWMVREWLVSNDIAPRVNIHRVTIAEHGGNSASYEFEFRDERK